MLPPKPLLGEKPTAARQTMRNLLDPVTTNPSNTCPWEEVEDTARHHDHQMADGATHSVREISCINMLSIKDAYLFIFVFLSLFFGSLPEYTPLRRIRPVALE